MIGVPRQILALSEELWSPLHIILTRNNLVRLVDISCAWLKGGHCVMNR